MSLEITLLQLMKYRDRYDRLSRAVPEAALDNAAKIILDDFGKFFREFPESAKIEYEPFSLWFRAFAHPTLKADKLDEFLELLKPIIIKDCAPDVESGLMERLLAAEMANRCTGILTKFAQGDEIDLYVALREEVDRYEQNTYRKVAVPWVDEDIADILEDDKDNRGLLWRLKCLNDHMRPLRGGDALIWAGRPGKGKTSSLIGEVTYMAPQFDAYYGPDHGRSIVWCNNEGPGRRIKRRAYQSALNATDTELVEMSMAGTLHSAYDAVMGGADRFRVMNIHGLSSYDVEAIFRRVKPGLIVFDMVDKIRFSGALANKGERTDQVLEAMYDWARDLGVEYGCPVISTSQTSGEAAGKPFPADSMLKDSKCLAPGTPVRMADGTAQPVEYVIPGDQVLGPDSKPRRVLSTATGLERMYKVSGPAWEFVCNESHILTVRKSTTKPMNGHEVGEVLDLPLRYFLDNPSRLCHYTAVRVCAEYPEKDLPMDPYLLGLWLGDGSQRECRITTGDPEILRYLEQLPTYRKTYKQESNCSDVYFGPRSWLTSVGVRMHKHIPETYKTASSDQRRALLAGLMDSDGWIDHGGSVITMSEKRAPLVDDIHEVAASLGYRVHRGEKPHNKSVYVCFRATDALPCLLERKVHKCTDISDRMTITPMGVGPYAGFTIDGDSRYVLGNYIATHNTGKQGACDGIVMLGMSDEANYPNSRFISIVKTKMGVPGMPESPNLEVHFDSERCRLLMPASE